MSSQPVPTAYVVDDDSSIRDLWRWILESNGVAVKTFDCAPAFIAAYRRGDPGCLVLDVRLPGMSGPELQEHLRREGIEIPIVFVSGHGDVPTAVKAIKGGAVDFIQKPFDYRNALATVGRAFEVDALARERRTDRIELAERFAALTAREREVLDRIIEGKSNKLIAEELDISVRTVEFHRANVMDKMRAESVAALVRRLSLNNAPD